jgi:hypothetical protein
VRSARLEGRGFREDGTKKFKSCHSSLGGEHGERIALVNDRFAIAFGGDPKGRH